MKLRDILGVLSEGSGVDRYKIDSAVCIIVTSRA